LTLEDVFQHSNWAEVKMLVLLLCKVTVVTKVLVLCAYVGFIMCLSQCLLLLGV